VPGEETEPAEIRYEVDDHVALVTLNRPATLNAWTTRMDDLYQEALTTANTDPEIRAVVVTGAGRGYCSGGDLQRITANLDGSSRHVRPGPRYLHAAMIDKPVLAAINGPCIGVGLVQAATCDIRFAAPSALFQAPFSRRGLSAEEGITWYLQRLIGFGATMELLLSGRRFDAREARALGLVTRITDEDVLPAALEYARGLAAECSPSSMAVIKRAMYRSSHMSVGHALEDARRLMRRDFDLPDPKEGVASFRQKRMPQFPPAQPLPGWLAFDVPALEAIE
jgi:enoyl-CoA hydratase/carnithine racemase